MIELHQIPNANCLRKCNKEKRRETTEDDLCNQTVSAIDSLPVRCVGEWSAQKIFHLIQYFGIFTVGMKNKWQGKINYIEICSGPGRCIIRSTGSELNGTSLSVVEHDAFKFLNHAIFFDINDKVVLTLNERLKKRKIGNASALTGDYNNLTSISQQILNITKGVGLNLVFIDPTDCSVPFALLTEIKQKLKNVDFIVNLAIRTDVNRNIRSAILQPHNHQNVIQKYSTFLGSTEFFNDSETKRSAENDNQNILRNAFRNAYMTSLSQIGYQYVDFKSIANYYDLVFASSHKKGIEFWSKANSIGFGGQYSLFNNKGE